MILGYLSDTTVREQSEEFIITVKVDSVKGINKSKVGKWVESIGNSSIRLGKSPRQLSTFTDRKASIKNKNLNKSASFELSNDNFDIKPVIFLTESKIKFKNKRVIDFDSLKELCFKILSEIEKDIYKI